MIKVKFKEWNCYLEFDKYLSTDNNAIHLKEEETDEYIATASVNLSGIRLEKDEVMIKDYSENEGMLKTLVNAKIIGEPITHIQSGFVLIPVCKILVDYETE